MKLQINIWLQVNQNMIEKIITEFSYEEIFKPELVAETNTGNTYILKFNEECSYQFIGKPRIFGNIAIQPGSVQRIVENNIKPAEDAIQLILDCKEAIKINPITCAHFIKEINNTLFADAHIKKNHQRNTKELLSRTYQQIEGEMHAHPWFVINKGRIGFSHDDYLQYAPEMQQEVRLAWLAVHKQVAQYNGISTLDYEKLITSELNIEDINSFNQQILKQNANPNDYYFMPVHDWQWQEVICQQFSREIARQDMIYLGKSQDSYLPMQSIRTFANISKNNRYSVKLPLSIFNTAVYRGLPGKRTKVAPMLTEWVKSVQQADSFLNKESGLVLLGEIASINYEHPFYSQLSGAPYQFNELLGVIWRESIHPYLKTGERAITMASLVHHDCNGKPFVAELIEQAGISVNEWLDLYFEKTLPPLLHCLYQYGMVFSPHGENSILILENNLPKRLGMKDFVDDINIATNMVPELASMPDNLKKVLLTVDDDYLLQFIQTGLFVVHYRYLSNILANYFEYSEFDFYRQVYDCILKYQAKFPGLHDRFERFDLFKPSFAKLCLNRLRILEVGYGDYNERPEVLPHGQVPNPLFKALDTPYFQWQEQGFPEITFHKVNLAKDLDILHVWMNNPHVAQHWRLAKSKLELLQHFSNMLQDTHQELFMIRINGQMLAYAETYRAVDDRLAKFYDVLPGDYGWHLLIGPVEAIGCGYAEPLMRALTAYCLSQPQAKRVLFEPDIRVVPFQRIAPRLGYINCGEIKFPEKQAYLFALDYTNEKDVL